MGASSVQQMADRIAALMEERLGARGATLADKLRHGGGKLPRDIRAEAEFLAESAAQAANPTLFVRLDHARIATAYDTCLRHLKATGRGALRRGMLMDMLARIALIVLVVAGLALAFAAWRGLF